jgi:alkanesulfonate monooxygenase SsuD/methylene tetrahydromethanopterin reductase-like flavin-dependent oxidoreductase (luciferase family)
MQGDISLIVRGKDASQQNLATIATQAEAWGFDFVWASTRRSLVQHLALDFVRKPLDNALATIKCFAGEVRPAPG